MWKSSCLLGRLIAADQVEPEAKRNPIEYKICCGARRERKRRDLMRAERRSARAGRGEGCATAGWHWRDHGQERTTAAAPATGKARRIPWGLESGEEPEMSGSVWFSSGREAPIRRG